MIEPLKSNINFGTKSILKTLYEDGNLDLTYGIYGGQLTRKRNKPNSDTLEHIQPHDKHGKASLENLALATAENNNKRSNKPLSSVFNKENFIKYCEQFIDIKVPYESGVFDGNTYIEGITRTVARELKKEGKLDMLM